MCDPRGVDPPVSSRYIWEELMARVLRQPKDPESVALAALALRHYVTPVDAPTKFEADVATKLKSLGLKKATAQRMLDNFDHIRPSNRERFLGPLGVAKRMPRRAIKKRDPNVVTPNHVVIPQFTLRRRFRANILSGEPIPLDPQVLAPIDYTITFEGMHCVDETHWDWAGSDEIYVVTSAVHITRQGDNVVRTERHPITAGTSGVYGDVDSHDTRIGPRASCWNGAVAEVRLGMSLTTVVFEHDYGDPDALRDEVNAAVILAIGIATYIYPPAGAILALIQASGLVTDFFNWLLDTGDDEIGTVTQVFELDDLEEYSRTRTSNYTEVFGSTQPTGLMFHFLAAVNDNDYVAAYQVQRNPRAPVLPQTPVD